MHLGFNGNVTRTCFVMFIDGDLEWHEMAREIYVYGLSGELKSPLRLCEYFRTKERCIYNYLNQFGQMVFYPDQYRYLTRPLRTDLVSIYVKDAKMKLCNRHR